MKFVCYWGEGYTGNGTASFGAEFFTEENGYTADDQAAILALDRGQVIDLTDPSGVHFVLRVE